jgi:hypothetical protein
MNILKLLLVLITCLFASATFSLADEVIITHRSGKVQRIQIKENGDPVEQVSFKRSAVQAQSTPDAEPVAAPVPEKAFSPKPAETTKPGGKPGIKIKWASPMDPQ